MFLDVYRNWKLHDLLDAIQANLASNLDSYHNKAKELIGTEKTHDLGFLKEQLKRQIETYIEGIVQNIINHIEKSYKTYNPFIQPHINLVKKTITYYLEEAIEISWKIKRNLNSRTCSYHVDLTGDYNAHKCNHLNNQHQKCTKYNCPIKV